MNFDAATKILSKVNGATFAGLDTLVTVKLKGGKKNPFQGRVTKRTEGSSVMLFTNKNSSGYANMVKRRLEEEGKDASGFELKARTWGERIPNTPFVAHKDKNYLECVFLKGGKSTYMVDGEVIDVDTIEGFDKPVVSDVSQGGLDNRVVIRTYDITSIEKMRVMGEQLV